MLEVTTNDLKEFKPVDEWFAMYEPREEKK